MCNTILQIEIEIRSLCMNSYIVSRNNSQFTSFRTCGKRLSVDCARRKASKPDTPADCWATVSNTKAMVSSSAYTQRTPRNVRVRDTLPERKTKNSAEGALIHSCRCTAYLIRYKVPRTAVLTVYRGCTNTAVYCNSTAICSVS